MVRPCVAQTPAYVPGEQPQGSTFIKLNTNENPYPPPAEVLAALQGQLEQVRLYPDPNSTLLRKTAADLYGVELNQVLAGNGSDDILNVAIRTFVDPGDRVAFPDLTYSLYETLTNIHGAKIIQVATNETFELDNPIICPEAKLIFLASPNPPLGQQIRRDIVEKTCQEATGVVVIDEAYVDFSQSHYLDFVQRYDHILISRTMSKGYSLAGARVGFGIGQETLIQEMNKVRDSYNLDRFAQAIATSALQSQDYFQGIWEKVRQTRSRLIQGLRDQEFQVFDSEANFVLASPQWMSAKELYETLREQKILVRYFKHPRIANFVRITVGTDDEIDQLLAAIARIRNPEITV